MKEDNKKRKKDVGQEWLSDEISEEVLKKNMKLYKRLGKK